MILLSGRSCVRQRRSARRESRRWREGPGDRRGYTNGMKTAVSIPDDVFEKVETLARRAGKSRSEVFSAALRDYVARHAPDEVTETINRLCDEIGEQASPFGSRAAQRVLESSEW